jgi:GNAT superfamily N-acetyltransferase
MTEILIRKIEISDIDECIQMTIESFGTEYPEKQFESIRGEFLEAFKDDWWGKPHYYVATIDDQIVGMAGYVQSWLDWDTFEFFWLSVRKSMYKKGIGKMLNNYLEEQVKNSSSIKNDITILFSCTRNLVEYHKKNGYNVLLEKADGIEFIMGKSYLK